MRPENRAGGLRSDSPALSRCPCFVESGCGQIGRLDPELRHSHVAKDELLVHGKVAIDLQKQDRAVLIEAFTRALDILRRAQHLMPRAVERFGRTGALSASSSGVGGSCDRSICARK
jgi:hypothetical protein